MGDLMEIVLLVLKVLGIYLGGAIGTTLLVSWLESKVYKEISPQDTYMLIATFWPIYLVFIPVLLTLDGFGALILQVRNSVLGNEEETEAQEEAKDPEATPRVVPGNCKEAMEPLMRDANPSGDPEEAGLTGATLRDIVKDPGRRIKWIYVTRDVLRIMERHPKYSPCPVPVDAPGGGSLPIVRGSFYGIPVVVDPRISGFCFYWIEAE